MSREVTFCSHLHGGSEQIVKLGHNGVITRVKTEYVVLAEFPVTVDLHQGSALRPFLFVESFRK